MTHIELVREERCLICLHEETIAHHVRSANNAGMGKKPDDLYTVPICTLHHAELHQFGELAFWDMHNVNPFEWIVGFILKTGEHIP